MASWHAIPGETPIDPSGLKIKGISTREELNEAEATNILKATTKYLAAKPSKRKAPFDFAWCFRLHREMFGDVWDWAGVPRQQELNIGVLSNSIVENFANLLADLHCWTDYNIEMLEQAVRLHFRAVRIHPFQNGNGRWSRMLANIWLFQNAHPIVQWPERLIGTESEIRDEYIAAIRQADDGDLNPLVEIHRRYLESE